MKPKFLIWPRTVISKHDGDLHYIGARKLMELYHVRPEECHVLTDFEMEVTGFHQSWNDIPILQPLYNGNYFDAHELLKQENNVIT